MSEPRTYSEIRPTAQTVTLTELVQLLAEAKGSATIFPGPRKHRVHAWQVQVSSDNRCLSYYYGNRHGYTDFDVAMFRTNPVIELYTLGRTVTLEVPS